MNLFVVYDEEDQKNYYISVLQKIKVPFQLKVKLLKRSSSQIDISLNELQKGIHINFFSNKPIFEVKGYLTDPQFSSGSFTRQPDKYQYSNPNKSFASSIIFSTTKAFKLLELKEIKYHEVIYRTSNFDWDIEPKYHAETIKNILLELKKEIDKGGNLFSSNIYLF